MNATERFIGLVEALVGWFLEPRQRIPTERLNAMCKAAHKAITEADCVHRLETRAEVSRLQNATRVHVLSAWAGDLC